MAAPWWKDPVTQGYNPPVEPGEDIGTPFHTPVTALLPGTVVGVSFGGYGARVDVMTAAGDVYYQHLDTIATGIRKGASVTAGQDLGLSGGQLYGGNLPNSPLNSTGAHIEVGEIVGGKPVDPSQLIAGGPRFAQFAGSLDPQNLAMQAGAAVGASASGAVAQAAQAGQGLVNVNFPDPFAGLIGAGQSAVGGVTQLVKQNIIPLVVAAIIILIVLGTGQQTQKVPQPVPVPIPV